VLGTFAAFEVGLALAAPQTFRAPRVWQHDPELGWTHRPGAHGRLVEPEVEVEVAIDASGLRGPEVPVEKPSGTRRVALFGDSFAEGWGVAESDTLRARLEERLRARSRETRAEVLSFGVAGYGTDQELLLFAKQGRRFAPDVVCLLFFSNDLWDDTNANGNGGGLSGVSVPKPRFQLRPDGTLALTGVPVPRAAAWDPPVFPRAAWWARLGGWISSHSQVLSLIERALQPRPSAERQAAYYQRPYGRPDADSRAAWELVEAIVRRFAQEARAAGARFVLVYVPADLEVEPEALRARGLRADRAGLDLERPSRELGRVAAKQGVEYLDLLPVFRAADPAGSLYLREGHWNARGHALAAQALDALLAEAPASP
jgi:hypothetical protein